jgi:hypothetical protein
VADVTIRRSEAFELALLNPRRGLTDAPRRATAASVSFLTAAGDAAGGPFPAVYDADADGWAALCPPRDEAVGTILTTVERVTVGGIVYESRGTLRVTA